MFDIYSAVPLWKRLKTAGKPIILYGMGDGAQKIIDAMALYGLTPAGIMASDDFCRGHSFAGMPVQKYSEIKKQFPDCIILVCFGTPIPQVIDNILRISAETELYAPDLPVVGKGLFTREYAEENIEALQTVYQMLADEKSRSVFDGWLEYRLTGRLQPLLSEQTEKDEAYSLLNIGIEETYADLGAYTGDTIEEFLKLTNRHFRRIYALEPDAKNYTKLKRRHYSLNPIDFRTYNAGAWSEDCTMQFVQRGGRNSSLTPYEKGRPINPAFIKDIKMRSLDSVAAGEDITLIKIDTEGSEKQAINGCKEIIKRCKPKMIVSLYHRPEDMTELPLLIASLDNNYKFYLRQQPCIPAWDMNLYCV